MSPDDLVQNDLTYFFFNGPKWRSSSGIQYIMLLKGYIHTPATRCHTAGLTQSKHAGCSPTRIAMKSILICITSNHHLFSPQTNQLDRLCQRGEGVMTYTAAVHQGSSHVFIYSQWRKQQKNNSDPKPVTAWPPLNGMQPGSLHLWFPGHVCVAGTCPCHHVSLVYLGRHSHDDLVPKATGNKCSSLDSQRSAQPQRRCM